MALLQIHDPAAAPAPVGIDLGTTNSLIAWVPRTGVAAVIEDCDGRALAPSVVHYRADGSVLVGKPAQVLATEYPQDTIVSVKRFMGRGADDPETKRMGPYRFAVEKGPVVKFSVQPSRVVTPVEVSAEILKALRANAEDAIGPVGGAVITVPAYFDDAQRQATRDAGRLAGFEVLRLLNEPTAAALAYGLDSKKNGLFVVYDLGGGTFDVTVLTLDDGVFQTRATGGDSQLGGDDMDRAVAAKMLEALGIEVVDASPSLVRRVLDGARAVKHALTESEKVVVEIEHEARPAVPFSITRAEFDSLVRPIVDRTGVACRRALRDAGIRAGDLDGVILVGGATRTPIVRKYVEDLFGQPPLDSVDPDKVVAIGAALQADMLAGSSVREDVLLLDVLPLSLGIETMGGVVERILPRNTPIPTAAAQIFTTYADNQTGFELHVVQGERDLAADCRSLARFTLRGIPPLAAGLARLEVKFEVDANGLLHVSARETTTGVEQRVEVKPSYGLSDEEIEKMLLDALEHGESDVKERTLRERRIEAERVIHATEKALVADGSLLTDPKERARIDGALADLRSAIAGPDAKRLLQTIVLLDDATKDFAARRMDASIRRALSGRDVAAVEHETADAKGIENAHAHRGPHDHDEVR